MQDSSRTSLRIALPILLLGAVSVCCQTAADTEGGVSLEVVGPAARQAPVPAQAITSVPRTPPSNAASANEDGSVSISLNELFQNPVGPRGLEYSDKAKKLNGFRVQITGYIVRQSRPIPWALLLSPAPLTLHEREYGLCEDLPMNTVHVFLPRTSAPIPAHPDGVISISGRLDLGPREEADERRSVARLFPSNSDLTFLRPEAHRPATAAVQAMTPGLRPSLSAVPANGTR